MRKIRFLGGIVVVFISYLLWMFSGFAANSLGFSNAAFNIFIFQANHSCLLPSLVKSVAANNVGALYEDGQDIDHDAEEAAKWYKRSADAGVDEAQANLGRLYAYGRGVSQDYDEALKWYWKAVAQKNVNAFIGLGDLYRKGNGVPQDFSKAFEYYKEAAVRGSPNGAYHLGLLYNSGEGVKQDYAEAYFWFSQAAKSGKEDYAHFRDITSEHLSKEQIAAVNKRVAEGKLTFAQSAETKQ